MSLRKITSLTSLLSFVLLVITAVAVYIAPSGRQSGKWELWGADKHEWQALHTNLGILLLVAGIIHIVLNIKPIVSYLCNKERKLRIFTLDFNLAVVITLWIMVSTLFELPPLNAIQNFREGRKHALAKQQIDEAVEPKAKAFPKRAPFWFGSRTLSSVCDEYGLDAQATLQGLEGLGIEAETAWPIKTIAEKNDMKSDAIFDVIRQLQ